MSKKPTYTGQMPLFETPSGWVCPTGVPDIPAGIPVAADLETRDSGLEQGMGPGWALGAGHVSGVSLAWQGGSVYLPLRHPDTANLDPEIVSPFLNDTFRRASKVVFHSALYDMGWMRTLDVSVPPEKVEDVQAQAVLLDENQREYGLDALCRRLGVPGKDEKLLREAAANYGVDPKSGMWRLPGRHVGPYAAQDAVATLAAWYVQQPGLEAEELIPAYRLEMDIVPMLIEMRARGMRIDESRTEENAAKIDIMRDEVLAEIRHQLGTSRVTMEHLNSPIQLAQWFDGQGVQYPKTPKTGVGSFKSEWMEKHSNWLPRAVVRARKLHDLSNKFLRNYILGSLHRGRIHAEIHPLRDDNSGTRSFRFSYSNPPLQQMPARNPELSPLCRECFLPERGELFLSADYSQQEPRMAVHMAAVANVRGAADAVAYYMNDPAADFHQMVADMTGISRKDAKTINLGMFYGMGVAKLARGLGCSEEDAKDTLDDYNRRMPWLTEIFGLAERLAQRRGFIRMIDGCRSHFDAWEPASARGGASALRRDAALRAWPGKTLRRAFTRDAFNRLVQGSSARQTKRAMLNCWNEGIIPLLQMHDELDFSIGDPRLEGRVSDIMIDAVKLRVPMKVDTQLGQNWAQASKEWPKGTAPPGWDELMAT